MKKYNFIGENLTTKNMDIASKALDDLHIHEIERESNDYRPPTQEEILNIEKSKKLIDEELKSLGIGNLTLDIDSYQFKFLNKFTGKGIYDSEKRLIEIEDKYKVNLENLLKKPMNIIPTIGYFVQKLLIKITQLNKNSKVESNYSTIIHESIHGEAFHKYELYADESNPESNIINLNSYRNGYLLTKNRKEDYFRGLNEGVVDKTTMDILIKEYKGEPNLINKIRKILYYIESAYFLEMLTVDTIVSKIAKNKDENKNETWARFKREQFNGNMMHLRDIEEIYGVGSLRVLATMNPRVNMKNIKNLLYYTYFSTQSDFIRKIIENKIILKKSNNKA